MQENLHWTFGIQNVRRAVLPFQLNTNIYLQSRANNFCYNQGWQSTEFLGRIRIADSHEESKKNPIYPRIEDFRIADSNNIFKGLLQK